MIIGIISAMPEEVQSLVNALENVSITKKGMRSYYKGTFQSSELVVAFSRWGKVAAAATATQMINDFDLDEIIFTGVAGALAPELKIGSVVLGTTLYQHDMDARPLFKRFEIPLLGKTSFTTRTNKNLENAVQSFANNVQMHIEGNHLKEFSIASVKSYKGIIVSGDQFIADNQKVIELRTALPDALCVEMEGAAVAQVCFEYEIPFSIIRIISDNANDDAPLDFPKFTKTIASKYAKGILENYCN